MAAKGEGPFSILKPRSFKPLDLLSTLIDTFISGVKLNGYFKCFLEADLLRALHK